MSRSDHAPSPRGRLLGRDYWLVVATPAPTTTAADIDQQLDAHLTWLLELETRGTVFLSGPLTSGPEVRPGSGITVLRATDADEALALAATDPFVLAGLRTVEVYGWRVNEGSIQIQLSLGAGSLDWA